MTKPRGLNDYLARLLHLVKPQPVEAGGEKYLKLVVFLPKGYEDVIMEALARAGAGWIGNYSHCTFQAAGTGTFLPREGTNPFVGEKGKLEWAVEVRWKQSSRPGWREVLRALLAVHPYEVAKLYPFGPGHRGYRLGRIGNLPPKVEDFSQNREI